MGKVLHTCSGCVPIDASIIDTYIALTDMVNYKKGDPGKSAYQIAVENGFEGTEEEWLASLKGDTGETPDITVGEVKTGAAGSHASATITGTPESPVLNMTIPQGVVGTTPNITIGEVTTGPEGSPASAVMTGTPESPVLNLTIPKGDRGNTGSSVEYPFELVNNTTTNDATKAATAAVAKGLKDDITQLDLKVIPLLNTCVKTANVDASALAVRNYYISGDTGKYTTNNSYKHSIFPVRAGQVVRVTANADNSCGVSFFRSDADPVSGGTPDYSSAYSSIYRVAVAANTYQDFVVPSDALWCYVYRGSNSTTPKYQSTPSAVSIKMSNLDPDGKLNDVVSTDAASVGLVTDAVFDGAEYDSASIDLSAVSSQTLSISASNTYDSTGSNGRIPVEPDEVLKVVGGGGRCAFVSGMNCPNSGSSVGAIETYTLESGKTYNLRAPSNAIAFVFNLTEGDNSVAPSAITKYSVVGQSKALKAIPAARWMTSGGALAYGANSQNKNYLFKLVAGHKYVFKISETNAQVVCLLLSDLPYVGESYTTLFNLNQSYQQGKNMSIVYNPENDCYLLFRLFKSSSPTLTVAAYDETPVTSPIESAEDVSNTMFWWRLNHNAFTLRSRAIGEDGLYGGSTTYKHILLPVKEGQYIKVEKGENNARLAWLTQDDALADYGEPSYVPGTSAFNTAGGIFRVPSGAKYLFIYLSASPYNSWPSYIAYSVDFSAMPPVVTDHDPIETRRLLFQFNSQTRDEINSSYKPLVLLHYSDIHGSTNCQNRINEYREFWKDYIDDTIQTGDLVTSYWGNNSAFGDETDPDNPCKDILCVIGNHDTASYSGGTYSWHAYQGKQSYDRYFAPWIENWGVVQPTGAADNGYCFYYKDYADSNIRLVVIDAFDTNESYQSTQLAWFEDVLADARSNQLSVIIASHFRIKCETLLTSTFTKPGAATENPDSSVYNDPFIPLVKAFIDAGGELVCWITGHSHYDAISKTSEANGSQINVAISLANRYGSTTTDLYKQNSLIGLDFDDWKTFDLFNIMAVDTVYKTISLFRVGSNWDKMGRRVETCCIKYNTGEIIYP